jgi:hypothetical protein
VTLIVVRHALPVVDSSTPPASWPLSDEGRTAAALLPLPSDAYLVASTEPKAYETLAPFGTVVQDERFGEIRRVGEDFDDNFRVLRLAYVDGVGHPRWEPHADAVHRFDSAVRDHLSPSRTLVIGTHGMVFTVWLTARIGLPSPGAFWSDLRFPDAYAVDLTARTATRIAALPAS